MFLLRSDTKYLSEINMSRQLCLAPKPKAQRLSPGYLCAFVPEAYIKLALLLA